MYYGFLADAIAAFHLSYVGFVVVGELLILFGAAMRWTWIRNPWFRGLHLAAIAVVAAEAVIHMNCPLTEWENTLRGWAGQETSHESFVGRIVQTIFLNDRWEPWVYEYLHIGFGVLVLATLVLLPPRWRRRSPTIACTPGATA